MSAPWGVGDFNQKWAGYLDPAVHRAPGFADQTTGEEA